MARRGARNFTRDRSSSCCKPRPGWASERDTVKTLAIVVLLAAIGVAVAIGWRGGAEKSGAEREQQAAVGVQTPRRLSSEAVLAIKPGAAREAPPRKPTATLLAREVAEARTLKSLYLRLKESPKRTAEEDRVLAEILQRCARVAEYPRGSGPRYSLGTDESRQRFLAALSDKDPQRDKPVAASERMC